MIFLDGILNKFVKIRKFKNGAGGINMSNIEKAEILKLLKKIKNRQVRRKKNA